MANRTYAIVLEEASGGNLAPVVFRDPATVPVDNTGGAVTSGARVQLAQNFDAGFGGATVDGHPTGTITAATNAAPIVLTTSETAAALGVAAGDLVAVEGVLGNINANGTFVVTSVSGSTITLKGSAGNAAYTSGGKVRKLNKLRGFHAALRVAMTGVLDDKSKNG